MENVATELVSVYQLLMDILSVRPIRGGWIFAERARLNIGKMMSMYRDFLIGKIKLHINQGQFTKMSHPINKN